MLRKVDENILNFKEYGCDGSVDLVTLINKSRHESSNKIIWNGFVQPRCIVNYDC